MNVPSTSSDRNPDNRKTLSTSFVVDPANKRAEEMAKKLVDAATLSKIHEEQVLLLRNTNSFT